MNISDRKNYLQNYDGENYQQNQNQGTINNANTINNYFYKSVERTEPDQIEQLLDKLRKLLKQSDTYEGSESSNDRTGLVSDTYHSTTFPKEPQIISYGDGNQGEIRIPYDCQVTKEHYITIGKARTATRITSAPGIVTAKYYIAQNGIVSIPDNEIKIEGQARRCGNSIREHLKKINSNKYKLI